MSVSPSSEAAGRSGCRALKTLELDPRDWITMTNLGWALIIQGKFARLSPSWNPQAVG
jgi:hypothetical protein